MSYESQLTDTVVLERQSNRTDDAYATQTWATNVTTIGLLCQKSAGISGKEINSDKRVTIQDLMLHLPKNTDVIEEDRALINGKRYNILLIYNAFGHHLECGVEIVT